ncbi:flagellar hook-associated protein 3 [Escherichia coli]|uniref:Flagellar hook-associated protein 3 n=1 Tax=Escherichia coli TaxID=562 RepID=A0A377DDW7_ECOLX|nr:flagellar hook-associated protein 3 [Escherichia coli]
MLDSAIAALKTPVADSEADKETAAAALDKTNRGLKNSLNNVLTVRRGIRHAAERTGVAGSLGSDRALGQTQQMSDLVDVDWNATIHLTSCSKRHCRHRIKHLPICRDCRSSSSTNNFALKHIMKLGMFCLPALGSLGRAFFCLFCIVG